MNRFSRFMLSCVLAVGLLLTVQPTGVGFSGLVGVSEAQAQSKKKRKSLFSILFGKRKVRKKQVKRRKQSKKAVKRRTTKKKVRTKKTAKTKTARKKTRAAKKRKTARRVGVAAALAAAPTVVNKVENAKKVLVVGDFFAGGLADGLERAFLSEGGLVVIDKTSGSSGLVRTDIVDWSTRIPELVKEVNPDYLVMMAGSNDRQALREDGKRLKKRTEAWDAAYQGRVTKLAQALKATGKPFTWLGLPPVRFGSMNTDFLVFNEWYRNAASGVRGRFVDVWDGFADANGAYTRSGPDINGQIVLLRPKDGINLTKAGRRRLAFYVEPDIRRQLGGAVPVSALEDFSGVKGLASKSSEYDPAKSGKTRVISLDDPTLDGVGELAGAELDKSSSLATDQAVQVIADTSRANSAPSGRVDSYVWPPIASQQSGASSVAAR